MDIQLVEFNWKCTIYYMILYEDIMKRIKAFRICIIYEIERPKLKLTSLLVS